MIIQFLRKISPWHFVFSTLTYLFGIGIAHYLGIPLNWNTVWNGLIWIILIIISSGYLRAFLFYSEFTNPENKINPDNKKNELKNEKYLRNIYLLTSISCLAVSLIPLMYFVLRGIINPLVVIFLGLTFGIIYILEVFPDPFINTGLFEFLRSIYFATLIPSLAFIIQSGYVHRLIFLLTFPLVFLFFAFFIVLSVSAVENNNSFSKESLVLKIGSINVLRLHNLLILFAYLLLGLEIFFDLPWKLIWPGLVALPIALFQVWQIHEIELGRKPVYPLLVLNAIASTSLTTYFILLALWLN